MSGDETDDRPNALLTKKDREWLRADEPLYTGKSAKQQRYRRRRSIRERMVASLEDFSLLFGELEEPERAKIIDDLDMQTPSDADLGAVAPSHVVHAVAFLFLLHEDTGQFEQSVYRALSAATQQRTGPQYRKISVDIDLEEWSRKDFRTLQRKVEKRDLHRLTKAEQDLLIASFDIDVLAAGLERLSEDEFGYD